MEEEQTGHGYYVTIPMRVLLDESLTPKARLLFGIIANLSNHRGYCFATNAYLAIVTGWHKDTISEFVTQLTQSNYVARFDQVTKNGLERRLKITVGSSAERPRRGRQNDLSGLGETALQNNIILNNKENNNEELRNSSSSPELFEVEGNPEKEKLKPNTSASGKKLYSMFVEVWLQTFPMIPPKWPRDGKIIKSLIQQVKDIMTKSNVDTTDEKVLEFWKISIENLPVWYKGKTLPVIDSHYPSIIDQILNHGKSTKQKQQPSKYSRQAGITDRPNGSPD